ncbi:neocarzinostatin apoprotein domain-containing protein [Nocardioides sp. CN2-186]|uniref:neocarzinostatin apoprotein domain-containing protein n=1 Tax=Nocardioides tweenelious TaxID=3156607 RepID=UPI0032B4B6B1
MQLFRKLAVALLTPVALVGAMLVVSPAANADLSPVLTISPTTDVADGTTIAVEGAGFKPASTVYVVQCASHDQASCDVTNLKAVTPDADGAFSTELTVHTGELGFAGAKCDPGDECLIAAGDPSDATNTGSASFTFAAGTKAVATKTTASYAKHKIAGTVTAGGKGVKGLDVKIQHLVGKKWKTVATLTTAKGGAFTSKPIDDAGKYRASTPKQGDYKGSTSSVVKVA